MVDSTGSARAGTLHYAETGPASGDVLLLVHGFPLHSGMWQPQLDAPPPGWRVIAPDLRGFGSSPPITGDALTMDAAADDLALLLRSLGISNVVVCGLSMGGYVAFALLRRHPALVRALLLCDTRAAPDTEEIRRGRLQAAAQIATSGTSAFMQAMLPKLLSPFTLNRRPDVVDGVATMMRSASAASVTAALRGLAARPDSTPLLRDISVPSSVVVGEDDGITPIREVQIMARSIPGARMEVVPDAGHLPNFENPAVFNPLLDGFLQLLR